MLESPILSQDKNSGLWKLMSLIYLIKGINYETTIQEKWIGDNGGPSNLISFSITGTK